MALLDKRPVLVGLKIEQFSKYNFTCITMQILAFSKRINFTKNVDFDFPILPASHVILPMAWIIKESYYKYQKS